MTMRWPLFNLQICVKTVSKSFLHLPMTVNDHAIIVVLKIEEFSVSVGTRVGSLNSFIDLIIYYNLVRLHIGYSQYLSF